MKEIWYRAYANYTIDGKEYGEDDYFCILVEDENDEEQMKEADKKAVSMAKAWAKIGEYFQDVGHVDYDLVEVTEVDGEKECFPELRTIWY